MAPSMEDGICSAINNVAACFTTSDGCRRPLRAWPPPDQVLSGIHTEMPRLREALFPVPLALRYAELQVCVLRSSLRASRRHALSSLRRLFIVTCSLCAMLYIMHPFIKHTHISRHAPTNQISTPSTSNLSPSSLRPSLPNVMQAELTPVSRLLPSHRPYLPSPPPMLR